MRVIHNNIRQGSAGFTNWAKDCESDVTDFDDLSKSTPLVELSNLKLKLDFIVFSLALSVETEDKELDGCEFVDDCRIEDNLVAVLAKWDFVFVHDLLGRGVEKDEGRRGLIEVKDPDNYLFISPARDF